MGQTNGGSELWTGVADAFSRINLETNDMAEYQAYGYVNGQSTLSAWLDSQPVPITSSGTNTMQWQAILELSPGTHQLAVSALHPSGFYTAWATNSFTNNDAYQATTDSYDNAGNITNRIWRNPTGGIDRSQTLSWDARGRLHSVVERDAGNSGYNWNAVYDALNRRLQTITVLVTNGVALTTPPQTINQYYDPQVEFLELGVSYNSQTVWKLYGPDMNGQYGGLNGTGGFEGFSPLQNVFSPVISDFRGNVLAEITNGVVNWNAARPTSYGAVPGYRPVALGNGADVASSSAWRGRWVDITGYYNIGLRPYDPVSGRWLTYDSVWNERDPNYLTFVGGDPINYFDSDGNQGIGYNPALSSFRSSSGQSVSVFQALFPVAAIGGGAAPLTGSTMGDIQTIQNPFYSVALPTFQGADALGLSLLTGPVGGTADGSITWGSLGASALRGALVSGTASATVAVYQNTVTGANQPVAPTFAGGFVAGAITSPAGDIASAFTPSLAWLINSTAGFDGNYAGNMVSQVAANGFGNYNQSESLDAGIFGAVMNPGESSLGVGVESFMSKEITESLTYQMSSEYSMSIGDSSLDSLLDVPESGNGQTSLQFNGPQNIPTQSNGSGAAYTPGPDGTKH
jgi:RHS repeat-associated protein